LHTRPVNSAQAREKIAEFDQLHAFICLSTEEGDGPVVAVKDLVDVRGLPTTGGGRVLPEEPAAADAPLVANLRLAGGLVIGKTNLHEFAFGVTGDNPHYGPTLNPRDPTRLAGGSSGGSAVAVATGMCDWAVGTDTGGSIRIPASLCGVTGYKPTVGTVDTSGVIPASWTLDSVGSLALDVATAALGVEMMTGRHDLAPRDVGDTGQFRLAIPRGWVVGLDAGTARAWSRFENAFEQIDFPDREDMARANMKISLAEGGSFHRRWVETVPEKYGPDVLERLQLGLKMPAWEYLEALQDRHRVIQAVAAAMEGWDALLLPATALVAPLRGAVKMDVVREGMTRFTRPFATTGQPVVTLPIPVEGLPVGLQVVGHLGRDAQLIRVAASLEAKWAR
jgi:aspartyl-tRNA(Asn)/glutamyl-tRNA(Gln) amidotransferase subunit A